MRKLTAIFSIILYLSANIGFAAQVKYCGNELVSLSISSEEEDCCECPTFLTKEKGCCSEEAVLVQGQKTAHQASVLNIQLNHAGVLYYALLFSPTSSDRAIQPSKQLFPSYNPPGEQVLYCTFLI